MGHPAELACRSQLLLQHTLSYRILVTMRPSVLYEKERVRKNLMPPILINELAEEPWKQPNEQDT